MRRLSVARVAAALGTVGTISTWYLLPWAHYGVFTVEGREFPGWSFYNMTSLGLNLISVWAVERGVVPHRSRLVLLGYLLAAATLVAAVAVAAGYRDGTALLGPIVPAVVPRLGAGAVVAVLAALAHTVAITLAPRTGATTAPEPTPPQP